jgi:hypothetical protein
MSGLEVIGVILGLFPIVISAVKVFKNRDSSSKSLGGKLEIEATIYNNTVTWLLREALGSELEVESLLRRAQAEGIAPWEEHAIKEKIRTRLGSPTADRALDSLIAMKILLDEVKAMVEDNHNGRERVRTTRVNPSPAQSH